MEFSQLNGWDRNIWVHVTFKLDHLQSDKPLLFLSLYKLFHFHTGEPFLITPEGQ